MKVNIVIPMAGRGSRFANEGYVQPKPLIDVGGKVSRAWLFSDFLADADDNGRGSAMRYNIGLSPAKLTYCNCLFFAPSRSFDLMLTMLLRPFSKKMIERVLDNVDSNLIDAEFILLVLKEQQVENDLISQLRPLKARMKFVIVNEVTEGAACTALLAKEHINNDFPLLIANSDQYVLWDVNAFWSDRIVAKEEGIDGDILCFHVPLESNDKKWSYASVGDDGYLVNLKEKEVISENATVGLYYWAKGLDFVESAEAMIDADDRVNGEFYVAPAYNYGVKKDRKYTLSFCAKMYGLGVPHDLTTFLSDYARPKFHSAVDKGNGESGLRRHSGRTSGPLIFIAHRGNIDGPNPAEENKPEYLLRALSMGFDVELDAWFDPITGQWALGHDEPQYPVKYDFLLTPGFWVHAKNGTTLQAIVRDPRINCFFHDKDEYTITSRGYIWAYPNVNMAGTNCIAVSEFLNASHCLSSFGEFY